MIYLNEFDPGAAEWCRELMRAGLIPEGKVDERSIAEVKPSDIEGVQEAHFFAGIAGWPYALRLAGWPVGRPVWTGSCPCQPFSSAGKRKGTADERHLWPEFRRLIAECRPATIFGEQVASNDGRKWLSGVRADLEALGYAVGAADLCAAGTGEAAEGWVCYDDGLGHVDFVRERIVIGAPHIRQRLFWVAHCGQFAPRPTLARSGVGSDQPAQKRPREESCESGRCGGVGAVGDASSERRQQDTGSSPCDEATHGRAGRQQRKSNGDHEPVCDVATCIVGNDLSERRSIHLGRSRPGEKPVAACASFWSDYDTVLCRDTDERGINKARRVEPGTFPLAHGLPGRVGLLRGYGNAIVPQVAAAFIRAFLEAEGQAFFGGQ